MKNKFLALRLFVRVARLGSFSGAARELGLSQPSASRVIASLEREVGASLMTRTTRAVILTTAGRDYLASAEVILELLDEADRVARGPVATDRPLRVALPAGFPAREIVPLMPAFLQRYPAARVELTVEDRSREAVEAGIDIALRLGDPGASGAATRLIARTARLLAASPAYLKRHGVPRSLAELASHSAIPVLAGADLEECSFDKDGLRAQMPPGRFGVSSGEAAVAAAVAGLGVVSATMWVCRVELATDQLVRLLPDWQMGFVGLHALLPSDKPHAIARAFVDHLVAALGNVDRRAESRPRHIPASRRADLETYFDRQEAN